MKVAQHGLIGLVVLSIFGAGVQADVLANSFDDFSGVQGQDDWFYGYYRIDTGDFPTVPGSFQEADNYNQDFANQWSLDGTGDWLGISAEAQHPHIPGAGRNAPGEYWATRRWVSNFAGDIELSGFVDEGDLGGDGVVVRLFIDGVKSGQWDLLSVTNSMIPFTISATVSVGSTVDLTVDPKDNIFFDGTTVELNITGDFMCRADLNGDCLLDFFDISAFLTAFGNQDSVADFTDDGVFDFFDISAFLVEIGAGCP